MLNVYGHCADMRAFFTSVHCQFKRRCSQLTTYTAYCLVLVPLKLLKDKGNSVNEGM